MDDTYARELIETLEVHNELMAKRNEMLRESVDQQKKSFASAEEHQRASLQALDTPHQLEELKQLFAQALELWSCDMDKDIPLRFRQLQELLPDPVWDDLEQVTPDERVIAEVLAERKRQVNQEGWKTEHDDKHGKGELAQAAACYAIAPRDIVWPNQEPVWPWSGRYNKTAKHGQRRCLIIAAALLVAEIERLDRKNGAT
jgi:hypothetical protein